MSVLASVVLGAARTLLNDDAAALWTDAVLMPKLQQAHRELQVKLRFASAPVMRATEVGMVLAGGTSYPNPTDMIEPIRLWEKSPGDATPAFVLMTESDPLPNLLPAATMIYWNWDNETIKFIGSTADRTIKVLYWRSLTIPTLNTSPIGFINGEIYLAPRVAALAAGSVGEEKVYAAMSTVAESSLNMVILANRGRMPPSSGTIARP